MDFNKPESEYKDKVYNPLADGQSSDDTSRQADRDGKGTSPEHYKKNFTLPNPAEPVNPNWDVMEPPVSQEDSCLP